MCSCIDFVLIQSEIFNLKINSIFISGNQIEFFTSPAHDIRVTKMKFSGHLAQLKCKFFSKKLFENSKP
jgi:hypothetical protein